MSVLIRDLQFSFRQLVAARGLTALALLVLSLGIGANTAMFTVVDDVMLRPLPYTHADRLVSVNAGPAGTNFGETAWPNYVDLERGVSAFSQLATYSYDVSVLQSGDSSVSVTAPHISANLFPMLGVRPMIGRNFTAEEGRDGGPQVVLLSAPLWRGTFHSDPGVVGRVIKVSGKSRTVIGVMPEGFDFPNEFGSNLEQAVWLPAQPTPAELGATPISRGFSSILIIGNVRPGVSVAQAQSQVDAVAARIRKAGGDGTRDLQFWVAPYQSMVTGDIRSALEALTAALVLVLVIACANVANMLVARFLGRRQELAVRIALGASRQRLVRQLLTEGALLSVGGCVCGLAVAQGALALVNRIPRDTLHTSAPITLHWAVLAVMAAVASATTLLSTLLPALLASRTDPQVELQQSARGLAGGGGRRVSRVLVAGEVALSTLLLMATGLLFHTLWNLEHADLGFRVAQVSTFNAVPSESAGFASAGGVNVAPGGASIATTMYAPLLDRLRAAPGVEDAALMSMPPFTGFHVGAHGVRVSGLPERTTRNIGILVAAASEDYANLMGISVMRGRFVTDSDTASAPKIVVVNESFAKAFFGADNPIGHQLSIGGKSTNMADPYTIVGVVANQPEQSIAAAVTPLAILPYQQIPPQSFFYGYLLNSVASFMVKTHGDVPLNAEVRPIFAQYAPGWGLDNFQTMRKMVDDSLASQRLSLGLTASFAGLAVLMLVSGLYGVLAQLVAYRRREIGIRMALGATRNGMAAMVLRETSVLVGAGLGCGLALSFALGQLLRSFLYGVSAVDLWSVLGVAAIALVFGALASLAPAYRAASVEPMDALRE